MHAVNQAFKNHVHGHSGQPGAQMVGPAVLWRGCLSTTCQPGPLSLVEATNFAIISCAGCCDVGIAVTEKWVDFARRFYRSVFTVDAGKDLARGQPRLAKDPCPIDFPIKKERFRIARDSVKQV